MGRVGSGHEIWTHGQHGSKPTKVSKLQLGQSAAYRLRPPPSCSKRSYWMTNSSSLSPPLLRPSHTIQQHHLRYTLYHFIRTNDISKRETSTLIKLTWTERCARNKLLLGYGNCMCAFTVRGRSRSSTSTQMEIWFPISDYLHHFWDTCIASRRKLKITQS